MGEIVNLRQVRKQRARAETAEQAAANRARHGRTKAQVARDDAETVRRDTTLDQARLVEPGAE